MSNYTLPSLSYNRGSTYEHPMYRYLPNLIPRRLKSLFRLCEQVFIGPQAGAGIRKIAEYPVTDPEITTDNVQDKTVLDELHRNVFHTKREVTKSMYNMFVYGNDFTSFHEAFIRYVQCEHCPARVNISKVPTFTYHYKTTTASYECPECGNKTTSHFKDMSHKEVEKCSIVHWDPKTITIIHNPVTKESRYFYTPSAEMRTRVTNGDRHLVSTLPLGILESIAQDTDFLFDEDQIYHMRVDAPSGIENESGWGIPIIIAAVETYLYLALMRKGNEAIALERIESFRVMFPTTTSPTNDPSYALSMAKYIDELVEAYEQWRSGDRNEVMFTSIPVGVAQVGGDARPLLTHQEILAAEDNILAILGIPREFVYGGMTYGPGSAAVLRQIENQLVAHISQSSGFIQWITNKMCAFKGMKPAKARLGKFTIQDDAYNKQAIMQLRATGDLSADTMMRTFGLSADEENEKIVEEAIAKERRQIRIEREIQAIRNDLLTQAQAKETAGPNYDINSIMAMAEQQIQGMAQDPSQARAVLSQLQNQDPVMYSVVKVRWEQMMSGSGGEQQQQM